MKSPTSSFPLGAIPKGFRRVSSISLVLLGVSLGAAALGLSTLQPAHAGPVVCTTSLEAPPLETSSDSAPASPVEVTRCQAVQTVPDLMQRRFYTWASPYTRAVSLTNQVTELFGIAMGGGDGSRVMGLGFADQAIIWDGQAIQNTYNVLNEQQSDPMPLRTADVTNGFSGHLGNQQPPAPAWQDPGPTWSPPVRGLW